MSEIFTAATNGVPVMPGTALGQPPSGAGGGAPSVTITGNGGAAISIVPRETLNNAAPDIAQQQLQCAAAGSYIGFGYGRCRTAIRVMRPIADATVLPNDLLIPGFIGCGPIDAIESVQLDNATLPAGITHTDYTGTASQTADASLVAAWNAALKTYADAMPGVAYTVLRCNPGPASRIGNFTAVVRHLKVYDPRLDSTNGGSGSQRLADNTTWAWSQNPVLALAHFLTTDGYGPEEVLDWSTVITCANIADQTITVDGTTQTRRQIGIFFDQPQSVDAIEETLRSYAGVFIDRASGATVTLIADAAASSTFAFTNASPSNYLEDSIQVTKRGRANSPTVVTIKYTDTTQTPWATQEVTVKAPGVDAGTEAWVETSIDWPGCQSAGMAYREAVRRLNEFTLADLTASLVATDEALQVRRGDVVTVTDSEGFAAKPFRVKDIIPTSPGRWQVSLTEYQAGLYSDTVYNGPVISDTSLPSPTDVPTLASVTLSEEVFQTLGGGTYASRIVATWTAPTTWPFTMGYKVTVLDGANRVIDSTTLTGSNSTEYRTAALQEGYGYSVFVSVVSSTGATGTAAAAYLDVRGTKLPPGDVATVTGVLKGSQIVLTWTAAVDIDLTGYEIRVGTTSDTWDTAATQIVRPEGLGLTATITGLLPGTWRCFVKARDSIRSTANPYGQYSTTAAYADFTVSVFSILAEGRSFPVDVGLSSGVVAIEREGQVTKYATDADTVGSLFVSALSTYTNPLEHYAGTSGSAQVFSAWYDLGQLLTGTFTVSWDVSTGGAVGSSLFGLSTNGIGADVGTAALGSSLTATARYVRVAFSFFRSGNANAYVVSNSNPIVRVIVADQMVASTIRLNDKAYDSPGRDATASDARTLLGLAAIATSGSASDLTSGTLPAGRFPALTGHVTTVAGALAATLQSVNSNVGAFGSATQAPVVTADAYGRILSLSASTVTPAVGSITGLGTGVATALAINVGSAGAPVTNGGALGTPSGGTLTSCTGLPAAGVVGTAAVLGANTFTAMQTVSGPLSSGTASILLRNGGDTLNTQNRTQIRLGYNNTDQYQHYIVTNHDSGSQFGFFAFYLSDGTAAGVFPTNAQLGLKIKNGTSTIPAVDIPGNLTTASVRGTAVTFANRPGTPVTGMMVAISDSNTNTWGATIAGGGANGVLAFYNGTNWTVAGK